MKYLPLTLAVGIALCASRADSQTLTTLLQFSGTDGPARGANPGGSLTLSGTTLYGMTSDYNLNGNGNVFSVGGDGTGYQNLVSFTGTGGMANGLYPYGSLTLGGTTLYGMTSFVNGVGNIFSVGTGGMNYQNLVSFGGTATGSQPSGNLTLSGTTLYGMTPYGNGLGNLFSVAANGSNYQNLLSFTGTGGAASGAYPYGSLTLSGTILYGMTYEGGANADGNIFSIGTGGTDYQNLLSFSGTGGTSSGLFPTGSLVLSGTTFYGMTRSGGADGNGNIFSVGDDGSNYRNLLSFTGSDGAAKGEFPEGSLILSGTKLYGMTSETYVNGYGNIFSVGIDGSNYQNLYSFSGGTDGAYPSGDLTLSGGTLFGMAAYGGSSPGYSGYGTVFALALPTPEPGTLALVGAGTVALASYCWRKRFRSYAKDLRPKT